MGGKSQKSFLWILLVGVCLNAAYTNAWGSYVCEIKEAGLQRIKESCSEATSQVKSPVDALEDKLNRVIEFIEDVKAAEDSWFHLSKKSGTVERDLSQHEETRREDADTRRDGDRRVRTEVERDGSSSGGDSSYRWQDSRRDSSNRYDRRNRRERTSEDRHERARHEDSLADSGNNSTRSLEEKEEVKEVKIEEEEISSLDTRKKPQETEESGPLKGECNAYVVDDHETIGMFYMISYQHGHCANRNPIADPIRYCQGYCATKTFIKREAGVWSQGNDCKSCQPLTYETIRIPLTCDDGFTFEKKFKNVVDCKCRRCTPSEDV